MCKPTGDIRPGRALWLVLPALVACTEGNVDTLMTIFPPVIVASGAGGVAGGGQGGQSGIAAGTGGATGGDALAGSAGAGAKGIEPTAGTAGAKPTAGASGGDTIAGAAGTGSLAGAGGAGTGSTAGTAGTGSTAGTAGTGAPAGGAGGSGGEGATGGTAEPPGGTGGASSSAGGTGGAATGVGGAGGAPSLVGGAGGAGPSAGGTGGAGGAGGEGGASGAGAAGGTGFVVPTPAPALLVGGTYYTCARFAGERLACWGDNDVGQLGIGTTASLGDSMGEMGEMLPFLDLGAGASVVDLTAGFAHVCARLEGGRVKCWGDNGFGQLGLGDTKDRGDQPGEMSDALPFVDLGAGAVVVGVTSSTMHTCGLLEGGRVKCWGNNQSGQLGLGDTIPRGDGPGEMGDALPFVDLGTGVHVVALTSGHRHTCALFEDGRVKCWGLNTQGSLGLGDSDNRGDGPGEMGDALPFVDLGTGVHAVALAAGESNTCARLDDGRVKCWGQNTSGSLGLGDTKHRGDGPGEMGDALPFVDLGTSRHAVSLGMGAYRTCVLLDNGRVKCWGDFGLGLGNVQPIGDEPGEMGDALPYVDLGLDLTVSMLVVGDTHSCAVLTAGGLKCWGSNDHGQLGLGDAQSRGEYATGPMGDLLTFVDLPAPLATP